MGPSMLGLVVLSLLDLADPVRLTSHLHDAGRVPGGEVRFVLRLEWEGEPADVALEELPRPQVENLRIVGVTRASRQMVTERGACSVVEIGYLLSPLRPGPARIDAIPVTYGFHGARQVLRARPVHLEIGSPVARTPWSRMAGMGGAVAVTALIALVSVRRLRRGRVGPVEAPPPLPPDLDALPLERLAELARQRGIEIPEDLRDIVTAHKYARQPAPPEAVERLRTLVRGEGAT